MQVWNVLQAARFKCTMQKWCKKSPSEHHRTALSGYIFATKAYIDNQKKLVKQQYLFQMSLQYGELRPANGWDQLAGLGHPIIFQRISRLSSVTARQSSSGRQPNFAALNRGRHLCSAGRPSRWALAHILVNSSLTYILLPSTDYKFQHQMPITILCYQCSPTKPECIAWVTVMLYHIAVMLTDADQLKQ